MIRYVLVCGRNHSFEGWFRNGTGFAEQVAAGQVTCPICGSAKVRKAPMAPNVAAGESLGEDRAKPASRERKLPASGSEPKTDVDRVGAAMKALREYVETNAKDVGRDFPEEARSMHYGEKEPRSIYGQADQAEVRTLREEGIPCLPVPWIDRRDN